MADVFLSYRNTPKRHCVVRRFALLLRVSGVSVWWDHDLEAGERFEEGIRREIEMASVVMPLWCARSVYSPWVLQEAGWGQGKLVPIRIQEVKPPKQFSSIHAHALVGWDGSVRAVTPALGVLSQRLGRDVSIPTDAAKELDLLPALEPLPAHDDDFRKVLDGVRTFFVLRGYTFDEVERLIRDDTRLSEFEADLLSDLVGQLSAPDWQLALEVANPALLGPNATMGDLVAQVVERNRAGGWAPI